MTRYKNLSFLLTVSVPVDMSTALAKAELKSLINEQCNYASEPGDVRVKSLKPADPPAKR